MQEFLLPISALRLNQSFKLPLKASNCSKYKPCGRDLGLQSYRELIFSRQVNYREETFSIAICNWQPLSTGFVSAESSPAGNCDTETDSLVTVAFITHRDEGANGCLEKKGLEAQGKWFSKNSAESESTADVCGLFLKQEAESSCWRETGFGNI